MSAPFVIHPESHLDHDLSVEHLRWLLNLGREHHEEWGLGEGHVVVMTLELRLDMDGLVCSLYGPAVGDPPITEDTWPRSLTRMERRPGRKWPSRRLHPVEAGCMVRRRSRLITLVIGPLDDLPAVLFTAYGGPQAPREPGDPDLPDADREESERFWAEHALVW